MLCFGQLVPWLRFGLGVRLYNDCLESGRLIYQVQG